MMLTSVVALEIPGSCKFLAVADICTSEMTSSAVTWQALLAGGHGLVIANSNVRSPTYLIMLVVVPPPLERLAAL